MGNIMKHGSDDLKNGLALGSFLGLAIIFGQKILDWITPLVPEAWQIFGDHSVSVIIVGISALAGYLIDKY